MQSLQVFQVLLLFLLLLALVGASTVSFGNETDRDALLAFKEGLDGHSGAVSSWNLTTNFCQWAGVTCSRRHPQRVSALDLPSGSLVGAVPPSIGNLTFLRRLHLGSNGLYAAIPPCIGRLRRLQYLNLGNNSLQGEIPEGLSNCSNLLYLRLATNRLVGDLPFWLGSLSKLQFIYLQENHFTGVIPLSIANISSLHEIYIHRNQLKGPIPEGLAQIPTLEFVQLSENNLTGVVPPSLYNRTSLSHFSIAINDLHGTLPVNINLPNIQYFLVGSNHFTGEIPVSLANSTVMEDFDISVNNFSGRLPPEFGKLCPTYISISMNDLEARDPRDWEFLTFLTNCSRLQILSLDRNMLGGMLPSSIANLTTQLQVLQLGFNEISGTIPSSIGNLVGLSELVFSGNYITGSIPDGIGKLLNLQDLDFEANSLSGFIPSSIGNLTYLLRLQVAFNGLEGSIPASLGGLQQLNLLDLRNNSFNGSLPREIFNISSLTHALDLSGNNLVGSLPPEVENLKKLSILGLARNKLSGGIPDAVGNCESLEHLYLDSNFFGGSIPASLGNLKGLVSLNLTSNNLSGAIPEEAGHMNGLQFLYLAHNNLSGHIPQLLEKASSLVELDLSFNHLEGPVPTHGVFMNMSEFSILGNDRLCGGIPELHLRSCPPESIEHHRRRHRLLLVIVIPVAALALCLILVGLFGFILFHQKNISRKKGATGSTSLLEAAYPRVSYAELVKATDGFASANLVGAGKYGSVYKGNLCLDKKGNSNSESILVAVKVFDLQQLGSSRSFVAECEALRRIRHRNLISIITSCSSLDSKGDDFKALVFDFMPNFSLDRWLHAGAADGDQHLSLIQRLNIAVDMADALEYLHSNCEPSIIHCDLRPSNVLLDEDLVAHIGDFGLAKLLQDSRSKSLIDSRSSIGIRGTIGYVAPEYGAGGEASTSGDAYSFGIVLLEMFTGKTPTNDMFRDGLSLHKFANMGFPERIMLIVDPNIISSVVGVEDHEGNAARRIKHGLVGVIRVGLSCSKENPAERMNLRDAAPELRKIRDAYIGA